MDVSLEVVVLMTSLEIYDGVELISADEKCS
jgi:hypothetical protein